MVSATRPDGSMLWRSRQLWGGNRKNAHIFKSLAVATVAAAQMEHRVPEWDVTIHEYLLCEVKR